MKAKLLTTYSAIIAIAVALVLVSCASHSGHRDEPQVDPPSGNERPAVTDNRQFEPELKDKVWRLTAPGLTLRYDRGGVLFQTSRSDEVRIIDLDGATDATFNCSGIAPDSMLIAPSLTVNGMSHRLLEGKLMGADATTRWYRLLATDSTIRVLVVPVGN